MSSWRAEAACIGVDPEAFFPELGADASVARKICADCPVRQDCYREAVTHRLVGIWGGTSDAQRKSARRAAQPARSGRAVDLDEFLWLVRGGVHVRQAASRMAVTLQTVAKAAYRAEPERRDVLDVISVALNQEREALA